MIRFQPGDRAIQLHPNGWDENVIVHGTEVEHGVFGEVIVSYLVKSVVGNGEMVKLKSRHLLGHPLDFEEQEYKHWVPVPRSDRRAHNFLRHKMGEDKRLWKIEQFGKPKKKGEFAIHMNVGDDVVRKGDVVFVSGQTDAQLHLFFVHNVQSQKRPQYPNRITIADFVPTIDGDNERIWWEERFRDWVLWLCRGRDESPVICDTVLGYATLMRNEEGKHLGLWEPVRIEGISQFVDTPLHNRPFYGGHLEHGTTPIHPTNLGRRNKHGGWFRDKKGAIEWLENYTFAKLFDSDRI